MAPERFGVGNPSNKYGKPSDIWSLGIVVFELATGSLPKQKKHATLIEDGLWSPPRLPRNQNLNVVDNLNLVVDGNTSSNQSSKRNSIILGSAGSNRNSISSSRNSNSSNNSCNSRLSRNSEASCIGDSIRSVQGKIDDVAIAAAGEDSSSLVHDVGTNSLVVEADTMQDSSIVTKNMNSASNSNSRVGTPEVEQPTSDEGGVHCESEHQSEQPKEVPNSKRKISAKDSLIRRLSAISENSDADVESQTQSHSQSQSATVTKQSQSVNPSPTENNNSFESSGTVSATNNDIHFHMSVLDEDDSQNLSGVSGATSNSNSNSTQPTPAGSSIPGSTITVSGGQSCITTRSNSLNISNVSPNESQCFPSMTTPSFAKDTLSKSINRSVNSSMNHSNSISTRAPSSCTSNNSKMMLSTSLKSSFSDRVKNATTTEACTQTSLSPQEDRNISTKTSTTTPAATNNNSTSSSEKLNKKNNRKNIKSPLLKLKLPHTRNYSSELCDFVECCLQRNPKDRSTAFDLQLHPFILKYLETNQDEVKEFLRLVVEKKRTIREQAWKRGNNSLNNWMRQLSIRGAI